MNFYGGKKEYNKTYNKSYDNKKPIITEKEIKYYEALRDVFKEIILGEASKVKKK